MGDFQRVTGEARRRLRFEAAKTSLLLSLLFLVVYSGTNWITSQRSDVGVWFFRWELDIPFIPLMIIPYMSIDFFFIAAPFLCGDRTELLTFTRRVVFAILTAGLFFLLVPLRLVFERAHSGGWLGAVFESFVLIDQPHNLFPSLHITLRTLLADLYARHSKGIGRAAVHVWFSLVGLSTVFTHQHQVIDVVGGFLLAGFCFYLFSPTAAGLPVIPNPRIGVYYGLGALAGLFASIATWPWGTFLLWPTSALGIVSTAYWGLGPGIYRKKDGTLPLSTRVVLGPVLVGQHLSLDYYRSQAHAWDEVTPGVWIGARLNNGEAKTAISRGVTAVLDLTCEFSEAAPFLSTNYRCLPILDLTAPTVWQLRSAAEFIEEQSGHGTIFVHCKIGYSRSAAAVGAFLLSSGRAKSTQEAVRILREARPSIVVRPEIIDSLREFERSFVPYR